MSRLLRRKILFGLFIVRRDKLKVIPAEPDFDSVDLLCLIRFLSLPFRWQLQNRGERQREILFSVPLILDIDRIVFLQDLIVITVGGLPADIQSLEFISV